LCRQVSNREPQLKKFSNINDVIIFVSGKKSSNGKMLYQSCRKENQNSYFISDLDELKSDWFLGASSVGICGATSTPRWLMESVQNAISKIA
jgi:4-hydroxy-3-methylbut-2-enyl diphosphate reductase